MCVRYANRSSDRELQSFFDTMQTVGDELPPSYNVAPTQPVRVILERIPHEEPDSEPLADARLASAQSVVADFARRTLTDTAVRRTAVGRRTVSALPHHVSFS
ncbi:MULTISPECIES: SOS response-associated peptidase family protein [Rhodococcus erythropolis group]|uniref:SOS response-associated peptidase family protein n=1 Tax=Rhodococcus erythropolis group TaxID=2840174 RepID=UPI0025520F29|nr:MULTISPECIES: SOS response-associated peptidase family protein [Rhodococcus erythropolis group]